MQFSPEHNEYISFSSMESQGVQMNWCLKKDAVPTRDTIVPLAPFGGVKMASVKMASKKSRTDWFKC